MKTTPLFSERFRHTSTITSLKLTPDGAHLLATGGAQTSVLSTKTGAPLCRTSIKEHGQVQEADISDAGELWLCSTTENHSNVIRASLDSLKETKRTQKTTSNKMLLSPSGHAFLGWEKKLFCLYSAKDGDLICSFEKSYNPRTNNPERFAFSPNGKLFASAPRGRYITQGKKKSWPIQLWSTKTGKAVKTLKGHEFALCDIAFSPKGDALVSIDRNGVVHLFSLATQRPLWAFYSGSWAAYQTQDEEHRIAFSPDGRRITVSLEDRVLCLLDAKTGKSCWKFRRSCYQKISPVVFSLDSERIFFGDGARVRILATKDAQEIEPPLGALGEVSQIYHASATEFVLQGKHDPFLWRASTKSGVQRILSNGEIPSLARLPFDSHDFTLVSRDASTLANLSTQETGEVSSIETGALICKVKISAEDRLHSAALSFDSKLLALVQTRGSHLYQHSEKDEARLSLFSTETACVIAHLAQGKLLSALKSPMFSPDSRFLACVNRTQVLLFTCKEKKLERVFHSQLGDIINACFSLDSQTLYILDSGNLLSEWSLADGSTKQAFVKSDYEQRLCDVCNGVAAILSPRGAYLYHIETSSIEALSSERPVTALRFSRTEPTRLIMGHSDGTISIRGEGALGCQVSPPGAPPQKKRGDATRWLKSFERSLEEEALALSEIEGMPSAIAEDEASLRSLRARLLSLWAKKGVTAIHRATSKKLLSCSSWRWHNDQRAPGHIEVVAPRQDGRYLAIGSDCGRDNNPGGTIQIYEMATGRCVQTIYNVLWGLGQGRGGGDRDRMTWSPNGELLGSSFNQDGVAVFAPFREKNQLRAMPHQSGGVDSGPAWCFLNDQEVVVGFDLNEGYPQLKYSFLPLSVYDISQGAPAAYRAFTGKKPLKGFDKETPIDWDQWLGASTDGKKLCVSARKPAMVIDAQTGEILFKEDGSGGYHSKGALFSPDANWYYNGDLYSTKDGKKYDIEGSSEDSRWSPDSKLLALATGDEVCLYSPAKKKTVARFSCKLPKQITDVLLGDSGALAFSPDSKHLAVREESQISVWDISAEPKELARIKPTREPCGLALGERAETLACWGREHVELWRVSPTKQLNLVTWTDNLNQYYRDEAGHPLWCAGGNASSLFERDPSFPVQGEGWITAFRSGLIVCPPSLRSRLHQRLSLILGDWLSWPLEWAIDGFTLFDDMKEAMASPLFPQEIVPQLTQWQSASRSTTNTGLEKTEHGLVTTHTLGWYQPEDEIEIKDKAHAEQVLRSLEGRLVRVESESSWSADKSKIGVPYEFKSDYAMIGLQGGGSGSNYQEIRKIAQMKFMGHPEEAIQRAPATPLITLAGVRVALINLTWSKDEALKLIQQAGATLVEPGDAPGLLVLQDPYNHEERLALLARIGATKSIQFNSLRELYQRETQR